HILPLYSYCLLLLVLFLLFLFMTPPLPRPTLFPYTTLFRSRLDGASAAAHGVRDCPVHHAFHARPDKHCHDPGRDAAGDDSTKRSEEHTSELQSRVDLVCRLLLEKKKKKKNI